MGMLKRQKNGILIGMNIRNNTWSKQKEPEKALKTKNDITISPWEGKIRRKKGKSYRYA